MRAFETEGVGVGFSFATGMAVTARMVARLAKMVVRCMVVLVCSVICCLFGRE